MLLPMLAMPQASDLTTDAGITSSAGWVQEAADTDEWSPESTTEG